MSATTPTSFEAANHWDSTLPDQGAADLSSQDNCSPHEPDPGQRDWTANASVLWRHRRLLSTVAAISLAIGLTVAFLIPKQYESSARIMPPASSMGGLALLGALTSRGPGSLGTLGALAGGLLGGGGNTALFMDLLRSGTVGGHIIDRFDLQHLYHKRYRIEAVKALARRTKIVDDKKSGVITLTVKDEDPTRARDMAQAYLDELNQLVNRTNTSSARQERLFIENRLKGVESDLEKAQQQLSEFSSTHTTIDIKEQTRAMVDAASRLQAQLIVEQSGLDSIRQTYGDANIRVRSAEARVGVIQTEIKKMSGTSAALPAEPEKADSRPGEAPIPVESYPALRQLPRLAVPYANLYREVQVQQTVYELLTQQYEVARIQEAKDTPVVSVIDAPGIPEKKSFPPRLILALICMVSSTLGASFFLLLREYWLLVPANDPAKQLVQEITSVLYQRLPLHLRRRGVTL